MKNGKKPRVVIDTNVLVSALVFGGKPRQVTDLLPDQTIEVVVSHELLTELRRKILSKFSSFSDELSQLERLLDRDAFMVELGSVHISVCRDPDDNKFIETAVLGDCNYIVSGDKDLLTLKKYKDTQIVSPAEFLRLFS